MREQRRPAIIRQPLRAGAGRARDERSSRDNRGAGQPPPGSQAEQSIEEQQQEGWQDEPLETRGKIPASLDCVRLGLQPLDRSTNRLRLVSRVGGNENAS